MGTASTCQVELYLLHRNIMKLKTTAQDKHKIHPPPSENLSACTTFITLGKEINDFFLKTHTVKMSAVTWYRVYPLLASF